MRDAILDAVAFVCCFAVVVIAAAYVFHHITGGAAQ